MRRGAIVVLALALLVVIGLLVAVRLYERLVAETEVELIGAE
jgi:hypothetical protein